jgi:hypothetical protein
MLRKVKYLYTRQFCLIREASQPLAPLSILLSSYYIRLCYNISFIKKEARVEEHVTDLASDTNFSFL